MDSYVALLRVIRASGTLSVVRLAALARSCSLGRSNAAWLSAHLPVRELKHGIRLHSSTRSRRITGWEGLPPHTPPSTAMPESFAQEHHPNTFLVSLHPTLGEWETSTTLNNPLQTARESLSF